jgi:nucleotide-binding universal stress UspA family protein
MGLYRSILLGWNASAIRSGAWDIVLELARVHDARLVLHHVLPSLSLPLGNSGRTAMRKAARRAPVGRARVEMELRRASAAARARGVACQCTVSWGLDVADAVVREARRQRCDLIALGSNGSGAKLRRLFGGVATRVVRKSPVAVLVCWPPLS